MKIDPIQTRKLLRDTIPEKYWINKTTKFLIQGVDDKGTLPFLVYSILDITLKPQIPNRIYSESRNEPVQDSKRFKHITRKMIYAVDTELMKIVWTVNSLNFSRANHYAHVIKIDDYKLFDYWQLNFDVIITMHPVKKNILLKPGGHFMNIIKHTNIYIK